MRHVVVGLVVIGGIFIIGCSNKPTKEEFFAREVQCLRCYCASNAVTAEAALLDCAQYAQQCQQAAVKGISYDEAFARIYGRLYLLERHLGHDAAAEQYLVKYAHYHAACSTVARRTGRPHGEMVRLIENRFDPGLQVMWKKNPSSALSKISQSGN